MMSRPPYTARDRWRVLLQIEAEALIVLLVMLIVLLVVAYSRGLTTTLLADSGVILWTGIVFSGLLHRIRHLRQDAREARQLDGGRT